MTPTQKKLKTVEEELQNERRARLRLEGVAEERQAKLNELERKTSRNYDMVVEQQREMQSQLQWMRELVELIAVPADKLEQLDKLRERRFENMNGMPPRRMY